ncbi:hypothetical protein IW148_005669 [Coemansia sp. RSA 1199]|nr:hypothetical protein IW148_005669 [Coemansia sp. RSA 1199]
MNPMTRFNWLVRVQEPGLLEGLVLLEGLEGLLVEIVVLEEFEVELEVVPEAVPEAVLEAVLEVVLEAVPEAVLAVPGAAAELEVPATPAAPAGLEVPATPAVPEIQQASYSHWAVQLQAADYSVDQSLKTAEAISAATLEPSFEWPVSAQTSAAESDGSA